MSTMLEMKVLLSAASTSAAEELVEHIFMTEVSMTRWIGTLLLPLDPLLAMLIVYPFLFGVAKYLVGVCDRLEFLLGTVGVILVFVRMVLDRHLLESFLDLFL
jgi:hypothetical protein